MTFHDYVYCTLNEDTHSAELLHPVPEKMGTFHQCFPFKSRAMEYAHFACNATVGPSRVSAARSQQDRLFFPGKGMWQCVFSLELSPIIPPAQTRAQFKDPVPRTQ